MLILKPGVQLANLSAQMVLAAEIVNACYQNVGVKECVITSGSDGAHRAPLHAVGCALDFRSKNVPRIKLESLRKEVQRSLGPNFDVVLEDVGGENEHLHVEYDPA